MSNKITEVIFEKYYDGERRYIPFSDFPKDILPTDLVTIRNDPGYYSENNSWDSFTELIIQRERDKTEEEKEKSKKRWLEITEKSKEERRQSYLKLKKEFENE